MLENDRIRLRHMLDAAKEAQEFVRGRSRVDLDTDRMLSLSLIKELEIIGEASNKVSDDTKAVFPSIPWFDIIGMRNHLIHGYYNVDNDLVWDTVIEDLPHLIAELTKSLQG